jgi:hypothetical protein
MTPTPADDARAGRLVAVHAIRCQRRDLQKRRVGVNQRVDSLACGEFVAGAVLGEGVRAAACLRPRQRLTIPLQQRLIMRTVRAELLVVRIDGTLDDGHRDTIVPDTNRRAKVHKSTG